MNYTVTIRSRALRGLQAIPQHDRTRAKNQIDALGENPRPPQSVKLAGYDLYRVRVGNYRIVYAIDDGGQAVEVELVAHRRDVYRGL